MSGLACWLVAVSWMRWIDPIVDFGREVYLPWRVLEGEHLGREFVHPYGPLSVYGNAGLFAVFGVSLRTLVVANLVVFGGIVFCLNLVLRRSFGFLPAVLATLAGVAVFGFPHYWGINNYTYAAPYAHEATHGMLLLLLLLVWLGRPQMPGKRRRDGFVTGLLIGLGCLTKTEYVVVCGFLGMVAILPRAANEGLRNCLTTWGTWVLAGMALVFALAMALLTTALPATAAAKVTFNAICAPITYADYSGSVHVLHFLGADNLRGNLSTVALWGGGTAAILALITVTGRMATAGARSWPKVVFVASVLVMAGIAVPRVPWVFCGTVFPVLLGAAAVAIVAYRYSLNSLHWYHFSNRQWNRLLSLTAAIGMLGRMAFDPTISHYGFFQSLLAGTWLCAYLIGEWPRLAATSRFVQVGLGLAATVLLAGGTFSLVRTSLQFYRAKQIPVGSGADQIKGYNPQVYALPELLEQARIFISANTTPGSSLLVIPEGISLNYWTRRRHPLRIIDLLPATMRLNQGDVLTELAANPPETVVLVSRPNIEEFGIKAYGQDMASGKAIVDWVNRNYTVTAQTGAKDPLEPGAVGLRIYQRNRL